MVEYLTSYDDPTVGEGTVVNEVLFLYNDHGQLTHDYQEHTGSVDLDTTPFVQYVFEDGSQNTIRQTQLIYPSGRELNYAYGATNGIDDALSRVASLIDDDGTSHLVDYSYLGDRTFVIADDTEPQVRWTMVGTEGGNDPDTGDIYRGFDRFTRIKDNYWYNYSTHSDIDRLKYGYGRANTTLWKVNVVARQLSLGFDELYAYDRLQRLTIMQRGVLNETRTAINPETATATQCWQLDSTGNWTRFESISDGTDARQYRTMNRANEIVSVDAITGPHWSQPAYDRAGNITAVPTPNSPETEGIASYDAWNRLTSLFVGGMAIYSMPTMGLDVGSLRLSKRAILDNYTTMT